MKQMALVVAAALAAIGVAHARAAEVPPEVVNAVQALVVDGWLPYDPNDPENSGPPPPSPTPAEIRKWQRTGLLKQVNVTPAKASDWLINSEKTEYPSAWCGTGGCLMQIWSPGPDGRYTKIFSNQVRAFKVRRMAGKDFGWIESDFHGSVCGLAGAEACPWGFEWRDDGLGRPALRASWRFAKREIMHAGAAPQALDPITEGLGDPTPPQTAEIVAANARACAAVKGEPGQAGVVNRLPDINADGIDDWSYDASWLTCHFADDVRPEGLEDVDFCTQLDCTIRVWVSHRKDDGVDWQPVVLAPDRFYGMVYRPDDGVTLVELRSAAGVAPGSPEACDTFFIRQCVVAPISLSPKP